MYVAGGTGIYENREDAPPRGAAIKAVPPMPDPEINWPERGNSLREIILALALGLTVFALIVATVALS
jgi:hypothetical protein